ncbi:hypothetical protein [Tenacibaculum sp. 190524A02b]|uniref:hypothetical protein n=1 Tax=Tenacibaculum vairaonense TaxID=3137860 RepID=UPI0032B28366
MAKNISQENYGIYSLGLVLFNTIIGVKDYGLERNSLVRLNLYSPSCVKVEYTSQFIVRLFILLFLFVLSSFYIEYNNYQSYLYLYSLGAIVFSITPKFFFDFNKQFVRESLIALCDRAFYLIAILCFFVFDKLEVFYISLSYFLSRLIYFILTLKSLKSWIDFRVIDYLKVKKIFNENFLFWLTTVFNTILLSANQLVLSSKQGVLDLAIFSFALQFVSLLRILQNQFLRWQVPGLSEKISNNNLSISYINKKLIKSLLFSLTFSILLYISAGIIITNFYPNYTKSIRVLAILCIWSIFYGPGIVNSFILSNKIKPFVFFIISTFFASVSLFANVLLNADYILTALIIVIPHTISMFVQYYLTLKNYVRN